MNKKLQWNPNIFRKNDIRGIYKKDFDLNFVQKLAWAFVAFCRQQTKNTGKQSSKKLVVALGHDARLSSPEISKCLIKSLKQAGADVFFLGLVPSPLCFFASYFVKEITASIVVTASHNPPAFNGFKMMINQNTVCDKQILELQNLVQKTPFPQPNLNQTARKPVSVGQTLPFEKGETFKVFPTSRVDKKQKILNTSSIKGTEQAFDIEWIYLAFLKKRFLNQISDFPFKKDKTPHLPQCHKENTSSSSQINIVVDCGNGASGPLAQKVFKVLKKLSVCVHWLYDRPDGHFPNHPPDPSLEKNLVDLKKEIKKTNSHFGVAFDGDGDRLVVVGKSGHVLQGDELMSIFISDIISKGQLSHPVGQRLKSRPSPLVVADVKCGDWFFDFLKKLNQTGFEKDATYEVFSSYKEDMKHEFLNKISIRKQVIMWKSGHSLIRQKTIEQKAMFGGELSGHFFFCDEGYPIDDGLYSLLRLIEISLKTGKRPEELIAYKNTVETPEIRYPIKEEALAKKSLIKLKAFYQTKVEACLVCIDGVRVSFPNRAWGLARFSNTQKEWTFRFGGKNLAELKQIQADFYRILKIPL